MEAVAIRMDSFGKRLVRGQNKIVGNDELAAMFSAKAPQNRVLSHKVYSMHKKDS